MLNLIGTALGKNNPVINVSINPTIVPIKAIINVCDILPLLNNHL